MDFVLTLHSHLPYVLNHGRWPHGSDWICEAAVDTYLPLLETLRGLGAEQTPAPVTIGFTPVLANQLASPVFVREMEAFFEQRLAACDEAPASLAKTGEQPPAPAGRVLARAPGPAPRAVPRRRRRPRRRVPRARGGRTARDHRLRRDPRVPAAARARREHPVPARRRRGRAPPAVRPGARGVLAARMRLPAARSVGAVAHRAPQRDAARHRGAPGRRRVPLLLRRRAPRRRAGRPLGLSGDPAALDPEVHQPAAAARRRAGRSARPTRPTGSRTRAAPATSSAYVRDPRASMQVWSRFEGYPGDGVVPRVPQDALARRPQALAGQRPRRGPRRQGALRSGAGARPGARPRRPLRRAARRDRRRPRRSAATA